MPTGSSKLKAWSISFMETVCPVLRSQTGDGMFRAPLPEQRRCVPYSAPHPEADGKLLHGEIRESTCESSGWIRTCRLDFQGVSSPREQEHNVES